MTDPTDIVTALTANNCGCHEWRSVAKIGDWIHSLPGSRTVREASAAPDLWDEGRCELGHEELRARITLAGGIDCAHALNAYTLRTGAVHLGNGVHRWTVAVELGIPAVPVRMGYEPEVTPWAWAP